jgi:two-component system LytT family response regulator
MATKPLKNYEELLEEELFFRISKFHLINVNHVLSYQKEKSIVKMVGNTEIEVARRKRKEFMEFMDKKWMNYL